MLLPLISLMAGSTIHHKVAKAKRSAVFLSIAGALFATAYIFLAIAGFIWIARYYGPLNAALWIAALFVVLGFILIGVMMVVNAREARRARERRLALESAATVGLSAVRSQPMLAAGLVFALAANHFMGSRRS